MTARAVARVTCASYSFRSPDGYYGCWYVEASVGGRTFSHRHHFGKSGTRSPRPDRRDGAERLAARVNAAGLTAERLAASPHWHETTPEVEPPPPYGET